ncbi:hypothetical protein D9M72_209580 [compost metagenome]
MLPATGSTITPAISCPNLAKHSFSVAISLYGSVSVCLAKSAGTPAEVASPSPLVNIPEPALTKSESE